MKTWDLIGFGINTVDFLVQNACPLQLGSKQQANQLVIQGGGPASNGVCVTGRLGFKTGFITKLGQNVLSGISRDDFRQNGVSVDLIPSIPTAQPAASVVMIDPQTGDRTITYCLTGYEKVLPSEIPVEVIQSARVLLVDGYDGPGGLEILKIAAQHQIPSVIDIEAGDRDEALQFIRLATDVILPMEQAARLTAKKDPKEILCALRQLTLANLVITDGHHGSWGLTGEEYVHVPAFNVKVVDTTGCGDSYHGAYATSILLEMDFKMRLEFSSLIAAYVATQFGGRTGIPSPKQLRENISIQASEALLQHLKEKMYE